MSLDLWEGNPGSSVDSPLKGPVMGKYHDVIVASFNKLPGCRWFKTAQRSCDVAVSAQIITKNDLWHIVNHTPMKTDYTKRYAISKHSVLYQIFYQEPQCRNNVYGVPFSIFCTALYQHITLSTINGCSALKCVHQNRLNRWTGDHLIRFYSTWSSNDI